MRLTFGAGLVALWACFPTGARAELDAPMAPIREQIDAHAGQSGAYVLDSSDEALIARAWLGDHAQSSIDVQYFIWSTDNVGILAAEALLRAAERGVRVRVLVDDLLINAPDKSLIALARHPNIDIRIYNPTSSVGIPLQRRALNAATDFRGMNQRMHNKVFVVDGLVAITGGRNMACEYYDYNHTYNFRDRDVLLLGTVVQAMQKDFEEFWSSDLSVKVEVLYDGLGLMKKNVRVVDAEVTQTYRQLHDYAKAPENFAPEVRAAINAAPTAFGRLAREMVWGRVELISDRPGKNDSRLSMGGGGLTSAALKRMVESARSRVVIQSPYLVLTNKAKELFRNTRARGVRVRINTNSLASTDNLQAFSGYRNQRDELLRMGLEIYEFKPDRGVKRTVAAGSKAPVLGLHAKTMVVDSAVVFIGTFNLDPRSENLNTEVGVIIYNEALARQVESAIEEDMKPGNSWNAGRDRPDQFVPFSKRSKVLFWQLMPIKPLL